MSLRPLDRRLLDQLWDVARTSRRHSEAMLQEEVETSVAELAVLRAVARSSVALTASDVARELGCSRANASKLIDRLASMLKISRHVNPRDRRIITLRPTIRGIDALGRGDRQLSDDAARAFATLDADEKEELLALLQKVATAPHFDGVEYALNEARFLVR